MCIWGCILQMTLECWVYTFHMDPASPMYAISYLYTMLALNTSSTLCLVVYSYKLFLH